MKKKLISAVLTVVIIISLFSLSSCSSENTYDFSHSYASPTYDSVRSGMNFVYEDSRLKLNDDGTWKIDEPFILFIRLTIDKGTYTVEDGLYTFEGFEYTTKTTGKETDEGFEIYFTNSEDNFSKFATLYFIKD